MRSTRKGGVAAPERSRNGLLRSRAALRATAGAASGAARKETANQARRNGNGAVPYVTWWAGLYVEARGLRRGTTA